MHSLFNLFSGRISREQFRLAFLMVIIGVALFSVLCAIIAGSVDYGAIAIVALLLMVFGMVAGCVFLLGLTARRLHDLGRSGWYALLLFISPVNIVGLIILAVEKGNAETNEYGEIPRARGVLSVISNARDNAALPAA